MQTNIVWKFFVILEIALEINLYLYISIRTECKWLPHVTLYEFLTNIWTCSILLAGIVNLVLLFSYQSLPLSPSPTISHSLHPHPPSTQQTLFK